MSEKFYKTTPGPAPILGKSGEEQIVEWIVESSRRGFPQRKENIQSVVKKFLDQNNTKNPFRNNTPGGWYKSFLRRHPRITERHPEGVTGASSCVSQNDVSKWFSQIFDYLLEENYTHILEDPSRIFNSDEKAFMVCPKMKNVLAPRGSRNVYEVDRGNVKLNLTVLFTFNASGVTTPPLVISI